MIKNLDRIFVATPASVANIGSGYDCLALAVDLENEYRLYIDRRSLLEGEKEFQIELSGSYYKDDGRMESPSSNLFVRSFERTRKHLCNTFSIPLDVPRCPIMVWEDVKIPPRRGLGSSSSACVAGVIAAIRFLELWGLGNPDFQSFLNSRLNNPEWCVSLAMATDNCPDNVCASFSGGLTYSFKEDADPAQPLERLHFFNEKIDDPDLCIIALVPNIQMATSDARFELDKSKYSHEDAAFNISRSTCVPAVFRSRRYELLKHVTADRIHQRQRARAFFRDEKTEINLDYIFRKAIDSGAYGACIGGAGSTLIAFSHRSSSEFVRSSFSRAFRDAAKDGWQIQDISILRPNNIGWRETSSLNDDSLPDFVTSWLNRAPSETYPVVLRAIGETMTKIAKEEPALPNIRKQLVADEIDDSPRHTSKLDSLSRSKDGNPNQNWTFGHTGWSSGKKKNE